MTKRRSQSQDEAQTDSNIEVSEQGEPAPVQAAIDPVEEVSPPAGIELKREQEQPPLNQLSKEQIEASIKEKLSRRTDEQASDPFVPQTQLENEVKELAKNQGFQLTRGTEVGARLLARSLRNR